MHGGHSLEAGFSLSLSLFWCAHRPGGGVRRQPGGGVGGPGDGGGSGGGGGGPC
jgi:hypothetical protein